MKFYRIRTQQEAEEFIKIIPEVVSIDTEYVKGDPRTTQLLSVIVADDSRAWTFPPSLLPVLAPAIRARKLIFLQDYNHCDTIILLKNGCDLRETECHNLIDMHHLIDENAEHDLGSRVLENFKDNYKDEFWGKYANFEDAPEDESLEYQCKDGIYTYQLGREDFGTICRAGEKFFLLYQNIRSLSSALLETELNGLCVNTKLIQNTYNKLQYEINEMLPKLRKEFYEYCELWELKEWQKEIGKRTSTKGKLQVKKPSFNFESDKQISWLVYEALGCEVISKTRAGNPSTDFYTLESISRVDGRLRGIVSFKDLKALFGTFVKGMLERVENDRIYPHFNVSGTSTGRLSHSNPNMANLPRTGVIRNFFIPSEGMVLIGADYSQLEVVIEANLTEDKQLLKIINEGVSKHDITAEGLGIDRNKAKTLNFALQYGAGETKVAKIMSCSMEEAKDIYGRYWDLYSGVRTLKEKINKEIETTGQITNLAGRIRHFDKPKNKYEMFSQQRQAYNFLIQGVAAECCNRAFYRISDYFSYIEQGRALFSVHDEILCEVPSYNSSSIRDIVTIMEQSSKDFNFKYPLIAKAYGPLAFWDKA